MKNILFSLLLLAANSAYSKDSAPAYLAQQTIASGGNVLIKADSSVAKMKLGSIYVTITEGCNCNLEAFNAAMPKHKHGMFVKPTTPKLVSSGKEGRTYKIDGVKLHMPGLWILQLKMKNKAKEFDVKVPYQMNI